jgi:TonB family protein
VAIAIVDREPTAAEMRDNRLDFLIYRPISAEKAQAVLTQACEKMQPSSAEDAEEPPEEVGASVDSARAPTAAEPVKHQLNRATEVAAVKPAEANSPEIATGEIAPNEYQEKPKRRNYAFGFRGALAAVLVLASGFCLWRSRETVEYLSQTREGRFHVLREAVAAFFYLNNNAAPPVSSAGGDAQQDAYFSRSSTSASAPTQALKVVAPESVMGEARIPLSKASDFPQPMPVVEHQDLAPLHKQQAVVPESMKNSPPIAAPEVVAVNATQMISVAAAQSSPTMQQSNQPSGEPVVVSEETARALLIHTVNPSYPPEAMAQKLHGSVVLQIVVAPDGTVGDLKIVRGYFVLGQAAIAAVKQWRFQPYALNGHVAATQTLITINFSYPPG